MREVCEGYWGLDPNVVAEWTVRQLIVMVGKKELLKKRKGTTSMSVERARSLGIIKSQGGSEVQRMRARKAAEQESERRKSREERKRRRRERRSRK